MKVLVCGSRDWDDGDAVYRRLLALPPGSLVLHGAARGADSLGDFYARQLGHDTKRFPAAWDTYGKRAGFIRNLEMLDEQPDLVIAFQKNGSKGTQHTINEALRRGIPVEVFPA